MAREAYPVAPRVGDRGPTAVVGGGLAGGRRIGELSRVYTTGDLVVL